MSILSYFKRAQVPVVQPGQASTMLAGIMPGTRMSPPTRGSAELLQAYSTQPWLYACAEKAGVAVADQPWKLFVAKKPGTSRAIERLYRDRQAQTLSFHQRHKYIMKLANEDGLKEILQHPLLDALDAPCSIYFSGQQRKVLTSVNLDLVGEYYWVKERNAAGMPINFWPAPATWFEQLPTPSIPAYRVSFQGWQGQIPQSEILRFNRPNPVNPYGRGTNLARALGDEIDTYEYASKYQKGVLFNFAMPTAIVSGKDISPENTERLEQKWNQKLQGFWNAAKVFFQAGEVTIQTLPHNFEHLQLTQLRESERDTIIQTFGFPPEAFGIHEHGNKATVTEWQNIMARGVTQPRLELIRGYLQNDLVPEYDDRLIIDYVSPIEDDKSFHLQTIKDAPWVIDVAQQRALLDLPDNGDGAGVYVIPATMRTRTLSPADNATVTGQAQQSQQDTQTQQLRSLEIQLQEKTLDMGNYVQKLRDDIGATKDQETRERIMQLENLLHLLTTKEPTIAAGPTINMVIPEKVIASIVVPAPEVTVNVPAAIVNVASPTVQVEAPIVNVPPAQVIVQYPKETVETIERDANAEITRIVRKVQE